MGEVGGVRACLRSRAASSSPPSGAGELPPLIRLVGISHVYDGPVTALDDVTLDIVAGESVALLGANGCGKSTLLRVLDALLAPTRGSFALEGRPISEDSLEDEEANAWFRSRVGFVFQNTDAQLFSASVREEIAFGAHQLGLSVDEAADRTWTAMRRMGIEALADRPPFRLSGGQKKRVALASVLVMEPRVILMDEPTSALDPRSRAWLIDVVDGLRAAGTTLVIASHDLDSVAAMTSRAVVLGEDHRVAADAPTPEVLADRVLLERVNLIAPSGPARTADGHPAA